MKSANRFEPLPSWWQHASLQTGIGANKNPNRSKPFAPVQEKTASQSGKPYADTKATPKTVKPLGLLSGASSKYCGYVAIRSLGFSPVIGVLSTARSPESQSRENSWLHLTFYLFARVPKIAADRTRNALLSSRAYIGTQRT